MLVFVSFAAYIVGRLMFAIATWRARVLPRWAAALLVVVLVAALALNSFIPGALLGFGVALVWLGAATVIQSGAARTEVAPAVFERA